MRIIVHGADEKIAHRRLQKVLSGNLSLLALSSNLPTAVVASDDAIHFDPYSGEAAGFGDEHFEANIVESSNSIVFTQNACSCGHVTIASDEPAACVSCGESLDANTATQIEINANGEVMKKKSTAAASGDQDPRRLKAMAGNDESVIVDNLDDDDVEEIESEGDDEDLEDENLEDEGIENFEGSSDEEDDELDAEEEEDFEEDDEDVTAGDDEDSLEIEEENEEEDEAAPAAAASNDALIVCESSVHAAFKRFAKRALARVSASSGVRNQITASAKQGKNLAIANMNVAGVLAAECSVCCFHTIASEDAKKVVCKNCGAVMSKNDMVAVAMKIDTTLAEDDFEILEDDMPSSEAEGDESEDFEMDDEGSEDLDVEAEGEGDEEIDVEDEAVEDIEAESELEDESEIEDIEAESELEDESEIEDPMDDEEEAASNKATARKMCKSKKKKKAKANVTAGDDENLEDDGDHGTEIEELDLSESTSVEASDNVEIAYVVTASNPVWQLNVNNIPVATLSRADVRGELQTLANDRFSNQAFSKALSAAIMKDRTQAITVAKQLGFKGIRIPTVIDRIVVARSNAKIAEASVQSKKAIDTFTKTFAQSLKVAAAGINKGFYSGVPHPVKQELLASMQKAGVPGAAKLIGAAYASAETKYVENLVGQALSFMNKSPETQREIAQAIGAMAFLEEGFRGHASEQESDDSENGDEGGDFADVLDAATTASSNADNNSHQTTASSGNFVDRVRSLLPRR